MAADPSDKTDSKGTGRLRSLADIRKRVHHQLDPEAWTAHGFSPLNWLIIAIIVISIAFGILATERSFESALGPKLILIDRLILGFFAIELVARMGTAGLNPRFQGKFGLLKFFFQPATIADLVVLIPLFLAAPPTWVMIFRLLRVLRLIRLASIPRVHTAMRDFFGALSEKRFEFILTLCFGLVLILTSSTTLYLCERTIQPEIFGSIPRALWWSVVTFTTVGYGDAVPVTTVGRLLTGFFAICGVGVVAMLTGIIASALSDAAERHRQHQREEYENPDSAKERGID